MFEHVLCYPQTHTNKHHHNQQPYYSICCRVSNRAQQFTANCLINKVWVCAWMFVRVRVTYIHRYTLGAGARAFGRFKRSKFNYCTRVPRESLVESCAHCTERRWRQWGLMVQSGPSHWLSIREIDTKDEIMIYSIRLQILHDTFSHLNFVDCGREAEPGGTERMPLHNKAMVENILKRKRNTNACDTQSCGSSSSRRRFVISFFGRCILLFYLLLNGLFLLSTINVITIITNIPLVVL